MSYGTQGSSNLPTYDCCNYAQDLHLSTAPLQHQLYFGAEENCNRCIYDKMWFRQDPTIVDVESELRNQTRPLSNCNALKYNPNCPPPKNCISTFSPNAPVVIPPNMCPIVYNNIPRPTGPGYSLPNQNICPKESFRQLNNERKLNGYNDFYGADGNQYADLNVFLNSCSNKPLYQGGFQQVRVNNLVSSNMGPVQPAPENLDQENM